MLNGVVDYLVANAFEARLGVTNNSAWGSVIIVASKCVAKVFRDVGLMLRKVLI